ncbi:MAG: hypothetical protein KA740_14645 [Rhodoferax sp.]|jgi:hypothetical protein|nr:hypothetical protein [Rhodoferax sp.]
MDKIDFESQLSLIEAQLAFLREASLAVDPTHLPSALAELQPMLMVLSQTKSASNSTETHTALVRERLKKSLAMVSSLREGVIRQSVGVDRALSALVPATQSVTYGSASYTLGHQPYGSAARHSGEFKMVVA